MDHEAEFQVIIRSLRGPLNFMRQSAGELYGPLNDLFRLVPLPQRVFLEDESSTPLTAYPVLVSAQFKALQSALDRYVSAEERMEVARFTNKTLPPNDLPHAWQAYRRLLETACGNAIISSYGRHLPGVFWFFHSLDIAARLKSTPKMVARINVEYAREHGAGLKYKIFQRITDRAVRLTHDLAGRLAADTDEVEQKLFPGLLNFMQDNVLVLTEDYISPDLAELKDYFSGSLHFDFRSFSSGLKALRSWHLTALHQDIDFSDSLRHLLDIRPAEEGPELLKRPGYISLLSTRPGYDDQKFLDPSQVKVWESLLIKLKEFEFFHQLRKLVLPLYRTPAGHLAFRERSLGQTWVGSHANEIQVSDATRPMDFFSPWVVDPQVDRFGLIYDITDFTEVVSFLQRSSDQEQDHSFRSMFRFQRRVNQMAHKRSLTLEKYLGDGAFYSARDPLKILTTAILVQRAYREALQEGLPFDRGMRIALNYGRYRLLPIQDGRPGQPDRYEFFGHGVVELSRLTTGKASKEVEEIKTMLVGRYGYPRDLVREFFAPITERNVDLVDRREESRKFFAYINPNGNLVNEGIVATGQFFDEIESIDMDLNLACYQGGLHRWTVLQLLDDHTPFTVGIRKIGPVQLKGLGPLAIFEIRDGANWTPALLEPAPFDSLQRTLERNYTLRISNP